MFRLIRLVFFVSLAFVAGMIYETQSNTVQIDRCLDIGGQWNEIGFCER